MIRHRRRENARKQAAEEESRRQAQQAEEKARQQAAQEEQRLREAALSARKESAAAPNDTGAGRDAKPAVPRQPDEAPNAEPPSKRKPPPIIDARSARELLNLPPVNGEDDAVMAAAPQPVAPVRVVPVQAAEGDESQSLRKRAVQALGLQEKGNNGAANVVAAGAGLSNVALQAP